jgi:tRNA modification GTPase
VQGQRVFASGGGGFHVETIHVMLPRHQDPIVAIATAPGRGAVGIVRVSGRGLQPLMVPLLGRTLQPRVAAYGPFLDEQGRAIDQGLALYFPAPASATGEDVLELQAHGGPVVLQLLLQRCLQAAAALDPHSGRPRLPALRVAEPGEFTQRAYLNHKIDLAQAEAIADLIDASTEAAARSATRSLSGEFSQAVERLRRQMVELRMLVEATLDFPEEEIDFLERAQANRRLAELSARLDEVLAQARQGALLREGLRVVIAGQPNVGKSSLLNTLAGAELAIVTPIAGTTRDRISETIQIEGVPLHVVDTAGLRGPEEAHDEPERIGIQRSWSAIAEADALLFVHDLTRQHEPAHARAEREIEARLPAGVPRLDLYNKADAAPEAARALGLGPMELVSPPAAKATQESVPVLAGGAAAIDGATMQPLTGPLALSAKTGAGVAELRRRLLALAGWQAAPEGVFIARARHVHALQTARQHLQQAAAHAGLGDAALDLLAEELRLAHEALGRITGAFVADDLLGEIFSRFCMGK